MMILKNKQEIEMMRQSALLVSRTLAEVARSAGKPYQIKIYPPFGTTTAEGHAFGYFGSSVWAADVFKFLNENCK